MGKKEAISVMEVKEPKQDRRVLTLFLVLFPSLIIAGNWSENLMVNIALKGMLILYQFVILKQFLDSYYGYRE